eukprot:17301_1
MYLGGSIFGIVLVISIKSTRLLPSDGSIIHCAGQSNEAFVAYSNYLNHDTLPAVQMYYTSINLTIQNIKNDFNALEAQLNTYSINQWVGVQIGLSFSGLSTNVSKGIYDDNILTFINALKSINRPCWIRLGYEFNGEWNDYLPKQDYISAFKRITSFFRNDSWSNKYIANIWDWSADAKDLDYSSWYPGDEWVDWYGVNIFSDKSAPNSEIVIDFITIGCNKQFPIIFGESTPRHTGVLNGTQSWNEWFQPYFYSRILGENKCVRQFCYINWNWTTTKWPNWGDAQIQDNQIVGEQYQTALYKGNYFHSTNKSDTLHRLDLIFDECDSNTPTPTV